MERAAILGEGSQLGPGDLRLSAPEEHSSNVSLRLDDVERQTIVRVLDRCRGNHTQAAKMLDISRTTLYAKLKKYGL
jgi:transcriptional regulator of acetoin/glycerol metabolism